MKIYRETTWEDCTHVMDSRSNVGPVTSRFYNLNRDLIGISWNDGEHKSNRLPDLGGRLITPVSEDEASRTEQEEGE